MREMRYKIADAIGTCMIREWDSVDEGHVEFWEYLLKITLRGPILNDLAVSDESCHCLLTHLQFYGPSMSLGSAKLLKEIGNG